VEGDPVEMNRWRRYRLGVRAGTVDQVLFMHENDRSCCRREGWRETLARIETALRPPLQAVAVNLDPRW
jgi:hypothetical protein